MKTITTSKIIRGGLIFMLVFFLTVAITFLVINKASLGKILAVMVFGLFFCGIILYMIRRNTKSIKVLETGFPAQVTILEIKERGGNGGIKDDFVWLLLKMRIEIKNKAPYEIEQKETFPKLGVGLVKPGVIIPAMISQEDPNKIEFLWIEYKRSIGK